MKKKERKEYTYGSVADWLTGASYTYDKLSMIWVKLFKEVISCGYLAVNMHCHVCMCWCGIGHTRAARLQHWVPLKAICKLLTPNINHANTQHCGCTQFSMWFLLFFFHELVVQKKVDVLRPLDSPNNFTLFLFHNAIRNERKTMMKWMNEK